MKISVCYITSLTGLSSLFSSSLHSDDKASALTNAWKGRSPRNGSEEHRACAQDRGEATQTGLTRWGDSEGSCGRVTSWVLKKSTAVRNHQGKTFRNGRDDVRKGTETNHLTPGGERLCRQEHSLRLVRSGGRRRGRCNFETGLEGSFSMAGDAESFCFGWTQN